MSDTYKNGIISFTNLVSDLKKKDGTNKKINVFMENDFQIEIPEFQRPYTWRKPNIEGYINTLSNIIEQIQNDCDKDVFFGQAIFERKNDSLLSLIDGQQRFTTTTIFVKVLLEEYEFKANNEILKQKFQEFIFLSDLKTPRLKVLEVNKEIFGNYIFLDIPKTHYIFNSLEMDVNNIDDVSWDEYCYTNRDKIRVALEKYYKSDKEKYKIDNYGQLINNFKHLRAEITSFKTGTDEFDPIAPSYIKKGLGKIVQNILITNDTQDALDIFQTLNSKGLPLTDFDLIKSLCISKLNNPNQWYAIENIHGIVNSDISEAVRIFSLRRLLKQENQVDLAIGKTYKMFDTLVEQITNSQITFEIFFESIIEFVRIYAACKDGEIDKKLKNITISEYDREKIDKEQINGTIELFMKLDYKPTQIILFDYLMNITEGKKEFCIREFNKIVEFCSLIPLIKVSIFGNKPSDIDKLCKNAILHGSYEIDDLIDEFEVKLNRTDFIEQLSSSTKLKDKKGKFVQMLLENNINRSHTRTNHLEHIYPQKPVKGEWLTFKKEDKAKYLNRIGNHIILDHKTNEDASNKPYIDKKEIYERADKNLIEVKTISNYEENGEWTKESIDERSIDVAKKLAKILVDKKYISKDNLN